MDPLLSSIIRISLGNGSILFGAKKCIKYPFTICKTQESNYIDKHILHVTIDFTSVTVNVFIQCI